MVSLGRARRARGGVTAFVANFGDDTVTPIDVASETAGTPIPVGDSPAGIAIAATSAQLVGTVATPCGSVTVSSSAGSVENLANSAVPVSPAPPAGASFPCGLLGFRVTGITPGVTVTVALPVPATAYFKFQSGVYTQVPSATFSGNQVKFTLTDGGFGDSDSTINGTIVDPGGPATLSAAATAVPALPRFTG